MVCVAACATRTARFAAIYGRTYRRAAYGIQCAWTVRRKRTNRSLPRCTYGCKRKKNCKNRKCRRRKKLEGKTKKKKPKRDIASRAPVAHERRRRTGPRRVRRVGNARYRCRRRINTNFVGVEKKRGKKKYEKKVRKRHTRITTTKYAIKQYNYGERTTDGRTGAGGRTIRTGAEQVIRGVRASVRGETYFIRARARAGGARRRPGINNAGNNTNVLYIKKRTIIAGR